MVALVSGQTPGNGPNKNLGNAARFLLPCVLAIAFCLLPNAANAEGRCPPGMFETSSRDFIACAPIPGYNQGGNDGGDDGGDDSVESRVPTLKVYHLQDSYMAAVTHIDTSVYWVSRGHWTADSANKRALASCKAVMGDGCVLAETVYGDFPFGVMYDAMGLPWIKSSEFPKADKSIRHLPVGMLCRKNSFGCEFEEDIKQGGVPHEAKPPENFVTDYFPSFMVDPRYGVKRHHWALLAKPEGTPPAAFRNKVWLISGSQNSAAARKSVLDRCRADSGVSCAIDTYVANGVLALFVDAKGKTGWTSAVTKRAIKPLGSYGYKTNVPKRSTRRRLRAVSIACAHCQPSPAKSSPPTMPQLRACRLSRIRVNDTSTQSVRNA